ncbi:hypothetical protein KOW79_014588 [Hemibagrus wyckioides]|uniref:Uncharacterized protein n=1 Tax=Hemibagrus wyckioides TaxID=337641 RepID=A0A9D3NGK3_9TELE|nr:hypothetical protein KOW79_014588 [Hemibagrus wyckioides]
MVRQDDTWSRDPLALTGPNPAKCTLHTNDCVPAQRRTVPYRRAGRDERDRRGIFGEPCPSPLPAAAR